MHPELRNSAVEDTVMCRSMDGPIGPGPGDWKGLGLVELAGWKTMSGEGRTGCRGQQNFRNWELLGQAGRGIRLLQRKEGAVLALNVMPEECGTDPSGCRETRNA